MWTLFADHIRVCQKCPLADQNHVEFMQNISAFHAVLNFLNIIHGFFQPVIFFYYKYSLHSKVIQYF